MNEIRVLAGEVDTVVFVFHLEYLRRIPTTAQGMDHVVAILRESVAVKEYAANVIAENMLTA